MTRREITPQERALLGTLAHAEGANYNTIFGGGTFDPSKGHPDRVVRTSGYASAAAGRYQFMPDTWREWAPKAGVDVKDMSPDAQDRVALSLIYGKRGVKPEEVAKGLTPQLLNKLAPEWASLPTLEGKSYYNQPVKSFDELSQVYGKALKTGGGTAAHWTGGGSAPKPQGPAPGQIEAGLDQGFDLGQIFGLFNGAQSQLAGLQQSAMRMAGDDGFMGFIQNLLNQKSPSSQRIATSIYEI